MTDAKQVLRYRDVVAEGLDDWRFFLMKLHARFKTGSFVKGLELVTRITAAAEEANHHPDIAISYKKVTLRWTTHSAGGITDRDRELAERTDALIPPNGG